MGCSTENGATLVTNFWKRKRKLLFEYEKQEGKN